MDKSQETSQMPGQDKVTQFDEARRAAAEAEIVEQSKKIDFFITEYSVELLAQKMKDNEFVVPEYQRNFTWEDERKSKFIESLLMGLPIPFIFFWERPDGRLEIVDGSQRLRTIQGFVLGGYRVGNLDSLPQCSNFSFADLTEARQRKVKNRSVRGIVLNEHADEQARLDMFERINTGSKVANSAEVRRGALAGPFMDLIVSLADHNVLKALAPLSEKDIAEREYEELVSRFFAYGDGLDGYRDRPREFIYGYIDKLNSIFAARPELSDLYRQRFEDTFSFVQRVFPYGFRRKDGGRATPRTRYEAIAVGTSSAIQKDPSVLKRTPDVSVWLESDEFREVTTSDGANAVSRLRRRINFVADRLLEG